MDTQAEPKSNEGESNKPDEQVKIDTKPGKSSSIKIINEKVVRLMGASEGQFVKDINDFESEVDISGKIRKINKADFEII